MATVNFSPIFNGWQGFNSQGQPLNAGLIYTYQAGTATPLATYTTSAGSVANTNPIVLGADGRPPQEIWLIQGSAYKFALYDSIGNLLGTYDNIYGVNDITSTTLATQIQNSSLVYTADTGAVNAYVITLSPAPAAYTSGMTVGFKTVNANTTTNPTLNVNTLGAITITGENGNAIGAGQIQANAINWVTYNAIGPRFELKSAASIGFIQSGTGAVARTVQDKERDIICVFDFMTSAQITSVKTGTLSDVTTPLQNAITAAGTSGYVYFPPGTYFISATLVCLNGQQLIGSGPNNTHITRTGDFGNTITFASAGACVIKGFWFTHGTAYVSGDTTLDHLATTGAHINLASCQGVIIEDCWMWRLPYQININSGSLVKIHRCNMQGTWDQTSASLQEGIASVNIGSVGYTQLVDISHCYFGGSGSLARNVTYTSSDTGAHVFSIVEDIGNQYGVLINQCEDFQFNNNYIGGNNTYCLNFNTVAGGVASGFRVKGNFIDGARVAAINFGVTTNGGQYATNVIVSQNVFNSELNCINAIVAYNAFANTPVLSDYNISNNVFMASVGSAVMMYHVRGGSVSENNITGYNARNVSAGGDLTFSSAVYYGTYASFSYSNGNVVGGAVNTGNSPSYCYNGIMKDTAAAGTATVIEKNTWWTGGGASGYVTGRVDKIIKVLSVNVNTTLRGDEDIVLLTYNGTPQITPAAALPTGYVVTIKDGAGTGFCQFVGTVDGVANPIYNTAYFVKNLLWNGTQWNAI